MLTNISKFLGGADPIIMILKFVVIPLAVFGSIMAWGYHKESIGYAKGAAYERAQYAKASAAERERQAAANEEAFRATREAIRQLISENTELEARLAANAKASSTDPARDNRALSPDSVRRIDSIR